MKKMLFALSALMFALPLQSASAQMVTVGTATPGSLFHSAGTAVAKVINGQDGLRATLQPFASANVYIPAVSEGDIDFGVATVQEVGVALAGKEHFEGRPQEGLRAVGIMFPLRFAVFVREDSDIRTIADLKGKSVPTGYSSQQIAATMMDAIYAAGGLTEADVKGVTVANTVAGADDFATGKVDAFFFALGAAKVSEVEASVGGIRALPFDKSDATLAAVRRYLPQAYFVDVEPGKALAGVKEPTTILAFDALAFASAKTSDDTVYKVTKALHDGKDALVATFPAFRGFDPAMMAKDIAPIEYHPGAIRYFKEAGVAFPEGGKAN
ncbi:TRAP transporter TAXI family solute receptor [Amorphus suaedae]